MGQIGSAGIDPFSQLVSNPQINNRLLQQMLQNQTPQLGNFYNRSQMNSNLPSMIFNQVPAGNLGQGARMASFGENPLLSSPPHQVSPYGGHSGGISQFMPQSPLLSHQSSMTRNINQQQNGPNGHRTLEQRRDLAQRFFMSLKRLQKPEFLKKNYGVFQDTERILQILTNAQYVEKKNQQIIRQNNIDEANEFYEGATDEHGTLVARAQRNGAGSDGEGPTMASAQQQQVDQDEEEKFIDIEDKKILNKRKKRGTKIEDCYLDLDNFFKQKKRLRPSELLALHTDEEPTAEESLKTSSVYQEILSDQKESLKKKLIEKYFADLPENEHTQKSILNYVKYMIKTLQFGYLTQGKVLARDNEFASIEEESRLIMEWVLENEPHILIRVCTFWIFTVYSIAPPGKDEQSATYYCRQLEFLLKVIEDNSALIYFSHDQFSQWTQFIKNVPQNESKILLSHVQRILSKLRIDHLQSQHEYLGAFIESLLVNQLALKQGQREQFLRLILEDIITEEQSPSKFEAMKHLLFIVFIDTQKLPDAAIQYTQQMILENFKGINTCNKSKAYCRNALSLFIEMAKRQKVDSETVEYIRMIFAQFLSDDCPLDLQPILGEKFKELLTTLKIESSNADLLQMVESFASHYDIKLLFQILVDTMAQKEKNLLSKDFIDLVVRLSKTLKSPSLLTPVLFQLDYEQVKVFLPLIFQAVKEPLNLSQLIEAIEKHYEEEQDKVAELVYLLLKPKFEASSSLLTGEESDFEQEEFVRRLAQLQDPLVKKLKSDTLIKVLERMIKNEKFHCKILVSLILLMIKQTSKEAAASNKGLEGTSSGGNLSMKEQAMALIKKILKKKAWDKVGKKEDWICLKKGLMIYFGNSDNWSKDVYRMWKDNIPKDIREEMSSESSDIKSFVHTYSAK